ncbi:MAG: hypothetical protein AUI14_06550 [Actinobacteria bacterium 13_2_20CM_2_71_6]|nr:MAG: hypothetical protein AUI14_06550 [Actinobacteria bacterium 13_2_20CM_2_71_6]
MNRGIALLGTVLVALVAVACKDPGTDAGASATGKPRPDLPSSMVALGDSINAHNLAAAGATVHDLPGQSAAAVGHRPDYVAILIGGNDACRPGIEQMTSTADFQAQFSAALKTLHSGLPKARVLVVSIPDVYRVWEVAHGRRPAQEAWSLGVCQSLLANPTSMATGDVARRKKFRDRIDAFNKILASACKSYGPRCRYDNGAAHDFSFSLDKINALDFFHPNADGQNELAKLTYPDTFTWG